MLRLTLLPLFAQVAPAPPPPAAPQPSTKVNEVRPGLFTTGLMTYETLGSLKAMGIGTVLHLRPEKEAPSLPATERKAVELMGLRYVYCPVTPQFEDEEVDAFRKQMKGIDLKGGLIVHCFNSNRAAGALLAYLVLDEKAAPGPGPGPRPQGRAHHGEDRERLPLLHQPQRWPRLRRAEGTQGRPFEVGPVPAIRSPGPAARPQPRGSSAPNTAAWGVIAVRPMAPAKPRKF